MNRACDSCKRLESHFAFVDDELMEVLICDVKLLDEQTYRDSVQSGWCVWRIKKEESE